MRKFEEKEYVIRCQVCGYTTTSIGEYKELREELRDAKCCECGIRHSIEVIGEVEIEEDLLFNELEESFLFDE